METVWFNELHLYPIRSFTYRKKQVRADEVPRVIVYNAADIFLVYSIKYRLLCKFLV
jgi:hypothetical protein